MTMKKILILDDEEELLEVLDFVLEDEGIKDIAEITMVTNGVEGIEVMGNTNFDCIVSDINMPKMNGIDFVKTIQENGYDKPVMFLSAHGDPETIKRISGLNIFHFIHKPFDSEDLATIIRRALAENIS